MSVSPSLIEKARREYPSGASVGGTPSFEIFERGPLDAAVQFFGRSFDQAPTPIDGVEAIRQWTTWSVIFGPLIFYAVRTGDRIEVSDYLYQPDYWDVVGEDPVD